MMNNKGQTLVIFVVLLPLLLIIMATVIDIGQMYYEKNKLDNINMTVIVYSLDNLDDNNIKNKITNLIAKNDSNIKIDKIDKKDNKIEIILSKALKSTFGKIIGIEEYKITSKYIGKNYRNKKEIKKG